MNIKPIGRTALIWTKDRITETQRQKLQRIEAALFALLSKEGFYYEQNVSGGDSPIYAPVLKVEEDKK